MPIIFEGNENIAYRDPTCYYFSFVLRHILCRSRTLKGFVQTRRLDCSSSRQTILKHITSNMASIKVFFLSQGGFEC